MSDNSLAIWLPPALADFFVVFAPLSTVVSSSKLPGLHVDPFPGHKEESKVDSTAFIH